MKAALTGVVNWFGSRGEEAEAPPPARVKEKAMPPHRAAAEAPEPPVVPDPPGAWTPARLRFVSALWGEGFTGPGGAEEALRLSKPLGLQSSHSLLNIGAGLGGAARAITGASGAWVSAYEQNPDLASAGEALSKKAKLEKKAEIKPLDPAAPRFRPNYYHHALVQEALWTVEDKEAMVAALAAAVKPAGQVVITDLTTGPTPILPDDETARAWMKFDRSPVHLMAADQQTRLFARHGLDIRIAEEISARHVQQAVASWRGMIEAIADQKPSRAQALTIIQEAELWLRRLALMRSGRLKLLRWHAIRR
jgi:cyclopropane fatty-acyl-phospholipid synthase-like methyltransferase